MPKKEDQWVLTLDKILSASEAITPEELADAFNMDHRTLPFIRDMLSRMGYRQTIGGRWTAAPRLQLRYDATPPPVTVSKPQRRAAGALVVYRKKSRLLKNRPSPQHRQLAE